MIDFSIMEAFGSTNARLKEVFTAFPNDDAGKKVPGESKEERKERLERNRQVARDVELRRRFEREIQSRLLEGIVNSLNNWKMYAAVDLAFDSSIINKMTIPLLLYAQGKVNVERCASLLSDIKNGSEYVKKDDTGKPVGIDMPKFVETEVNLVRSIILRRWAAQKNKYNNLWPYYGYESRSTGLVGKLRADVLSQRVDIMSDQFNYRRHDGQVMLDAFLYAFQLDFPRCSWEVEEQYRKKSKDSNDVEAYVFREGVGWFNPHPSRIFWDNASPLASINSDTGCEWMGFWDVVKFSEIEDNPFYFNKNRVGWTNKYWGDGGVFNNYRDYFSHYSYQLTPPASGEIDPSRRNDRASLMGFYAGSHRDSSVLSANYFRKIVPKDWGIGNYPFPVWVRLVTASDFTVIHAEFYPSSPAAYLGINTRDSRQVSVSMAMDLLPYQQQMSNLLTRLLYLCQIESFKAIGINSDGLSPEQAKQLKAALQKPNWYDDPVVFEYSLAKLAEAGIKEPKDIISVSEAKQGNSIGAIFEAIIKLISIVERLMALSPNEQGQPAPREISATEVTEIANTTSSIYSSISDDIDDYRAAKKRIVYESLVACAKADLNVPVKNRYTDKTIAAAGFKTKQSEDEDFNGDAKRRTVIGSMQSLVHDYVFNSRDGAERPVNTQAANTLVQLIGQVLAVPPVYQKLGKGKLYELFNEIFRLSGAGVDLNLQLDEGEDDSLGVDDVEQMKQTLDQITQYLNQMANQVQKNSRDLATQEQMNAQQEDAIKGLSELGQRVKQAVTDIDELQQRHAEINKRLIESINYKDAPPSIQRQMERAAGFAPATELETATAK